MQPIELETPVLIAGGGPIGMAMAIELGWRGIASTVLEQGDGSVDTPRLGIILTRTMEILRRWGIVDRIYNCGFNNDYALNIVYCTSMTGFLLSRDENPSCAAMPRPPQSPEKRQRCTQLWFNPILEKAAGEYASNRILKFCRLERFEDLGDCVVGHAVDTRNGQPYRITARYLVAADGGASEIRSALGIDSEGVAALSYSVNIFLRSRELLSRHDKGEAERYIFVGPQGTFANLTVVDGRELWRVTVIGSAEKMNLQTFDADAAVRAAFGRDDIPFEIISVRPWVRKELIASEYRKGRVFLAGDAAHTMSPTGGHGMTTGVGDVVDLGWKIQATMDGWAGAHLLDSYRTERRPVAELVAAASSRNFRGWISARDTHDILDDTAAGAATRRRIGEHMRVAGREDWDSIGLQLGYRYDDSPLCVPDGTPPPEITVTDYQQTARPGARAPHAYLPDGRSTLDLFGRGFVLLCFPGADDPGPLVAAARARGVPLQTVEIDQPEIAALYGRRSVLVRPDGFVAWRDDALPADSHRVIDVVRGEG